MKDYVKLANLAKTTSAPVPKREECEQGLLDVIHLDVWGPAQTTTFEGCRYYVTFMDDFSRHTWILPMRQKREVLSKAKSKRKLASMYGIFGETE